MNPLGLNLLQQERAEIKERHEREAMMQSAKLRLDKMVADGDILDYEFTEGFNVKITRRYYPMNNDWAALKADELESAEAEQGEQLLFISYKHPNENKVTIPTTEYKLEYVRQDGEIVTNHVYSGTPKLQPARQIEEEVAWQVMPADKKAKIQE